MSHRAIVNGPGIGGRSSGRYQSASASSASSSSISPPAQRAVNPIMSWLGNGHGWLDEPGEDAEERTCEAGATREEDAAVSLDEHDHGRRDARVVVGAAARAD